MFPLKIFLDGGSDLVVTSTAFQQAATPAVTQLELQAAYVAAQKLAVDIGATEGLAIRSIRWLRQNDNSYKPWVVLGGDTKAKIALYSWRHLYDDVPGLEVFPTGTSPFGRIGAYRTDLDEYSGHDGRRETAEFVKKVVLDIRTMQPIEFSLRRRFLEVIYWLTQETHVPEPEQLPAISTDVSRAISTDVLDRLNRTGTGWCLGREVGLSASA